jgi:hypothetical protein
VKPTASLTLGSSRYDAHLNALTVVLATLPAPGVCRAVLPYAAEVTAVPGDPASVDLTGLELASGGLGGLAGAALGAVGGGGLGGALGGLAGLAGGAPPGRVLTGTVRSVRRGLGGTEVEIADAGAALAAYRPATTFTATTAADVVSALAGDAGAATGRVELDLPLAAYVADQARTAAEHVARLATLAGGVATVGADGALNATPLADEPTVALRHGREVLAYDVTGSRETTAPPVAVGNGPAGAAAAPNALRPTPDPLPEGVPEAGTGAVWEAFASLRTPAAALAATGALQARTTARAGRVRARCVLVPSLRPGDVVEVQDLPLGLSEGPWLLTRVEHRLGAGGVTELDGVRAVAAGGGLLAALAGAIGSLL